MKVAEQILEAFGQDWKDRVARAEEMIATARAAMSSSNIRYREISGDLRPKLNHYTFKVVNGPRVMMDVQKSYVEVNADGNVQKLKNKEEVRQYFSSFKGKL